MHESASQHLTYTAAVRTIDTTARDPGLTDVEKTVWYYANGGTWSNRLSNETLVMGGSGISGTFHFSDSAVEEFLVTIG